MIRLAPGTFDALTTVLNIDLDTDQNLSTGDGRGGLGVDYGITYGPAGFVNPPLGNNEAYVFSHNGTTGSDSQLVGYAASWSPHNAEPHAKEPVMSNVRFIGLDVHAETIAVAVAEPDGEVRSLGVIPNRPESIRKLVKKLGPAARCGSATKRARRAMWCIGS